MVVTEKLILELAYEAVQARQSENEQIKQDLRTLYQRAIEKEQKQADERSSDSTSETNTEEQQVAEENQEIDNSANK
jgi:hypothetical protein